MASRKKKRRKNNASPAKKAPPPAESSSLRYGLLALGIIGVAVAITLAIAFFMPTDDSTVDPLAEDEIGPRIRPTVSTEDDPSKDGWDTEVMSQAALDQFKKLAKVWVDPAAEQLDPEKLVAPTFAGQALRPEVLPTIYEDSGVTVSRGADKAAPVLQRAEWLNSCTELFAVFKTARRKHHEVKVFRVYPKQDGFTTDIRLQASALDETAHLQFQMDVKCDWTGGEKPQLMRTQVLAYEQVVNRNPALSLFTECTGSVFQNSDEYTKQLVPGYDDWYERTPKVFDRTLWADVGLAVGDVNGDDLEDIYICEPGGLPNRLFLQNLDGTLTDASRAAGVDWLDNSRSALILDMDNDGDQDLVVALNNTILFMSNDGTGKFTLEAKSKAVRDAHAIAAADYDHDGLLDVYVCAYFLEDVGAEDFPVPIPYFDATNGGHNKLLRNTGDWKFEDVTSEVGLDEANNRASLAASWADYDNDGDMDLYVANDFGRNCLYQNNAGKFKNVAAEAGVEDVGSGMSATWGDYNGDGLMDIYISNMFSTAGSRVTFQDKFKPDTNPALKALYQRMAKGNTLFENLGNGKFRDVSLEAGVARARWAWGAPFIDINNDGREDLIVANGFVTHKDTHDL